MVFFVLGLNAWNFQAGHLMMIIYLIASVLIYIIYAFLARCPHCKAPVLLKPVKCLGMELFLWSLLAPDQCGHCGERLP